jgi:hypothetical protein
MMPDFSPADSKEDTMKIPELQKLLEYKNQNVLKLYIQNYPNNKLNAEDAFREMLKYLWLAKKHEQDLKLNPENSELPPRCVMLRSMREIDEMWHEFILFTKDYVGFCQDYFGEYLHHYPNIFDTMPISTEEEDAEIALLLPYIYDNLGEDTMRIWFSDYLAVDAA